MEFTVEFYETQVGRCLKGSFWTSLKNWLGKERELALEEFLMRRPTNFDLFLGEQLRDPDFAEKFRRTGEDRDIAIQLASLRKKSGLSQKELAKRVGTSQQQISRLESPSYEGHSLSMLRRVAEVLGGTVRVEIQHKKEQTFSLPLVAEPHSIYRVKRKN